MAGENAGTNPQQAQALVAMPGVQNMGAKWVRAPFFPTAPYYPSQVGVGFQVRDYVVTLTSSDTDYAVGTEALRRVQFDIPVNVVVINAAAFASGGLPVGLGPRDVFLFRAEQSTGDRFQTAAALASTVCGTSERPGEIGGSGIRMNAGSTLLIGLTPLVSSLNITVAVRCMELRPGTNYTLGGV